MDESYVNPFIASAINTFKTMLNAEVKAGTPYAKHEPYPTYDVSGIIGLSGTAQGNVSLSFPKAAALKVVSALLGTKIKSINAELTDGIGELANIITGGAKKDLVEYRLSMSLPSVIIGKGHVLSPPPGTGTIVVPFDGPYGEFALEVCLKIE